MSVEDIPQEFPFKWGQEIRFTGGKYNGFNAEIRWVGTTLASAIIRIDGNPTEVVERVEFMQDMTAWKASKTATELALKPNVT